MALNKFFLFYFSLIFNIFSDSGDKVKFIVKVQDVVNNGNGKKLKDLFSKDISIEKKKIG